ncbi:MAG: hypothetical protein ACLRZ7_00745 [Lachnospiraceae bacterium]
MKAKPQEIKVRVVYTEGYRDRFTEACLKQLKKKQAQSAHLNLIKGEDICKN